MNSASEATVEVAEEPFTIHSINSYAHMGLSNLEELFALTPAEMQAVIRGAHRQLVAELGAKHVAYSDLRSALVPQHGRSEIALVFDSTRVASGLYGYSLAEKWVPILRRYGPEKTTIQVGDILGLPSEFVWAELERHLEGPKDFVRQARELYFVVYLTNLSRNQLANMNAALMASTPAYLGYVDCSTWIPLKAGLFLPQVGLRVGNDIVTDMDDGGTPNQVGYPFEENGFRVVGVDADLYGPLLGHRIDNGVPSWADRDTAMTLSVLGGNRMPLTTSTVVINESRIAYLRDRHLSSLNDAGLTGHTTEQLAEAIRDKLANGLIYNLRMTEGSRDGVREPELDAMMFTVQVEFPDTGGRTKRYLVGMKYLANTHVCEIVTFF